MAYLRSMSGKLVILPLFLFFLVIPVCFSAGSRIPATTDLPAEKQYPAYQSPSLPHTDIERVHQPVVMAWHISARKNIIAADLLAEVLSYNQFSTASRAFLFALLQLTNDYLSHIYPFHNFW
jgi:hypothetical protein